MRLLFLLNIIKHCTSKAANTRQLAANGREEGANPASNTIPSREEPAALPK